MRRQGQKPGMAAVELVQIFLWFTAGTKARDGIAPDHLQ